MKKNIRKKSIVNNSLSLNGMYKRVEDYLKTKGNPSFTFYIEKANWGEKFKIAIYVASTCTNGSFRIEGGNFSHAMIELQRKFETVYPAPADVIIGEPIIDEIIAQPGIDTPSTNPDAFVASNESFASNEEQGWPF